MKVDEVFAGEGEKKKEERKGKAKWIVCNMI